MLVVTTPVDIVLLAMEFEGDDVRAGRPILHPTNFNFSTDNVNMIKVIGTSHGRIFACGSDGCVYELRYSVQERAWSLRSGPDFRCRKENRSASGLRCGEGGVQGGARLTLAAGAVSWSPHFCHRW